MAQSRCDGDYAGELTDYEKTCTTTSANRRGKPYCSAEGKRAMGVGRWPNQEVALTSPQRRVAVEGANPCGARLGSASRKSRPAFRKPQRTTEVRRAKGVGRLSNQGVTAA